MPIHLHITCGCFEALESLLTPALDWTHRKLFFCHDCTDSFGNSYVPNVGNGFCELKGADSTSFLQEGNESDGLF